MKTKTFTFLVLLCVVVTIFGAPAFAATAQKGSNAKWMRHISEDWRVDGAGWESYRVPPRAYTKYLSGGAKLTCEDIQPEVGTIIQHDQIGDTWYDFQRNGSMGRMISVTSGGYRHFSWMYADHAYPPGPRGVDANCKDPVGTYIGQVHADYGDFNAGYSNQTHLHDGTSVVVHHRTAGTPTWASVLTFADGLCSSSFSKHWDLPDAILGATSGQEGMWPKAEVSYESSGLNYIHIVMTEGNTTGGVPVMVAYERCYISPTNPDTLYCQSYVNGAPATYAVKVNQDGLGSFAPISHFDSSCSVAPVVAVSPVSQRVGVAYLSPACDRSCDYLADCCWFQSVSNGDDWIDGTQWPPIIHNITNFGCTGTERCFHDLSACYDYQDSLHVVYLTAGFDPGQPGYYQPGVARIYHWSKKAGISTIASKIQEGVDPGAHNCILAKPSVSAQDPIYHPGGDSVYLYAIWTQFDSMDVSAGFMGNGDIWGSFSPFGGGIWSSRFNLSNTQTPGCTPGNCVSEHWSSMAQNMYDGDLHIQYICDLDAGGAIQDGTQWMANPVMYLHLTGWQGPDLCRIVYRIKEPTHWYHPPLKVTPDGYRDLIFKLYNYGNIPCVYSATSDHPCILVSQGGIIPPADSVTVVATLDGTGSCNNSFIDGDVMLTTSDPMLLEAHLPVQAVVASDYFECPKDPETVDTLYNGVLVLKVNANCGESITDSASFPDTAHDIFFKGGTIVATTQYDDTLVGRYMYEDRHAGVRDKLYTDECDVDWEPDFWIVYTKNVFMHDFEPPVDYKWYWWELSKQIKFFKDIAPDVYKHMVIKYVKVRRHDPPGWWPDQTPFAGYEDTYIGVAEDIDCPYDTLDWQNGRNYGGYDPANQIAWQRGFDYTGAHPQYNEYYVGIALADGGQPGESIVPYGSYCVRSDFSLYPQGGWGWDDAELYGFASSAGNTIVDPGMAVDRSYVFTARKIDAGDDPDAEASFTVILAASPGGLGQLQEYVDSARAIVAREAELNLGIPVVCGDLNGDGDVQPGDIVYLLNYLFRDGLAPMCPTGRADCNASGETDAGDLVALINYLFRNCPSETCLACPGIWGAR